jgi:hypothetical protein
VTTTGARNHQPQAGVSRKIDGVADLSRTSFLDLFDFRVGPDDFGAVLGDPIRRIRERTEGSTDMTKKSIHTKERLATPTKSHLEGIKGILLP